MFGFRLNPHASSATIVLCLSDRYPEYELLSKYIRGVKIRGQNKKPEIFDLEKGALTDYEQRSLSISINQFSQQVISSYRELKGIPEDRYMSEAISLQSKFNRLLYLRFISLTARRPVQIFMLKWRDISIGESKAIDEFKLRMPMAKQGGDQVFRSSFEDGLIPLDREFSEELCIYKEYILTLFYRRLSQVGIGLSWEDYLGVSDDLPIFFDGSLFTRAGLNAGKVPANSTEFFLLVKNNSTAFHIFITGYSNVGKYLPELESDRGVDVGATYGANRARHTVGTNLSRKGYDELTIAMQLGNTPKAAGYYIDLLPDDRIEINNQVLGLRTLSERFLGKVIHKTEGVDKEINFNSVVVGNSSNISGCISCSGDRPLQCYGCSNFRPLANADHEPMLRLAEERLEYQKSLGADVAVLAPLKIRINDIKATILACKKSLSSKAAGLFDSELSGCEST